MIECSCIVWIVKGGPMYQFMVQLEIGIIDINFKYY